MQLVVCDRVSKKFHRHTGQKLLREMPAMTSEAMQASYGRLQKQMEAVAERAEKAIKENEQRKPVPKPVPKSLQN